jgi:RsiW-degrading membrane proteinase PrsW (M82 family)
MNEELHVTLGERSYRFGPGQTVRIGRSPDNDIVVSDPTVSRQHARLTCGSGGWAWENVGRALSLLDGQPVTHVPVTYPVNIQLASLQGPVLMLAPVLADPPGGYEAAGPAGAGYERGDRTSVMDEAGPVPAADPWAGQGAGWTGDPGSAPFEKQNDDWSGAVGDHGAWGGAEPAAEAWSGGQPEPGGWPGGTPGEEPWSGQPDHAAQPDEPVQHGWGGTPAEEPVQPQNGWGGTSAQEPVQPQYDWGSPSAAEPAPQNGWGGTSAEEPLPQHGWGGQAAGEPVPQNGWGAPPPENGSWGAAPEDVAWGGASAAGAGEVPREVPRIRPVSPPVMDELATALHILVPIRHWLHDPGWRQFIRLLVIPYGLLPLVFIALFASSNDLSAPGWAYSLYIAPLWAIVFWLLIRPGQLARREVGIAAGAIVFELIWIRVVTIHINGALGKAGHPLSFPAAIGVGINEEITKVLPILIAALLLLRWRSVKLDVRMWMFLGTVVGLAFGVTEQAGYTALDIEGIAGARANSTAIVEVLAFAERVFVDGFQHAVWAGVSAFFIGMAVNYRRRRPQLIAFGIAVPAVLHGLYDWSAGAFASLWIPIIIQAVSLFLFLGYTMSAATIERQVSETPMFRGESMLMERVGERRSEPDSEQAQPGP